MRAWQRFAIGLFFSIGIARPAIAGDEKAACASAAESGQTHRNHGEIIAARDAFLTCSVSTCPEIIATDCARWLGELERRIAYVTIDVGDASGRTMADARISIDGVPSHGGSPVALDPGSHAIIAENDAAKTELHVDLAEGERRHTFLTLVPPPPAAPASASSSAAFAAIPPPRADHRENRPPAITWVLLGASAVSLGSFAYFGATGRAEESRLAGTCAPSCAAGDSDAVRTKFVAADVSLALSAVAIGVAAWFFFSDRSSPPRRVGEL